MGKDESSSIKHWPEDERPRERFAKYGGESLSEAQLLAILIGSGDRSAKKNAVDVCRDLLKVFDNLNNLDHASIHELCQVKGIGLAKATQIKAALELGKRMASIPSGNNKKMTTSRAFVEYFAPFMKNLRKEIVKIALLDNKLHVINDFVISEGSVDSSIVHPREVMIPAIKESAAKIVLLHNHPSGDPTPSRADIEITHRVSKAGNIIGIQLLDHIIIGGTEYYSFADEGMI